ncbi:MAG TPA: sigma-70 family RNA polymerase sigma factor [Bryobacteraceae bacterium]|nr:sigma-70 family RNA polymerase sigma factor [Bryobacteraceae bacterium]
MPNPASLSSAAPDGPGRAALERAFDEHHGMVFRTAYRVTGNAADAEDVLQTVFLRLAARDGSSDAVDNAESYLRRAAVNASLNLLEQRARKNVPLEKAPEPHAKDDPSELREVLRQAMATLGGRTAEMFALRFVEGHSNGEIAEMFGVSSLVVAVTLHRARKQLQKEVRQLGGLK